MFKTEVILPKDKTYRGLSNLNSSYLLTLLLAFFIGRASIMDKLTPFSIAFISAYLITGKFNMYIFLSTMLGMFTIHGIKGMEYFIIGSIIPILYNLYNKKGKSSFFTSALFNSLVFLFMKLSILLIFKTVYIYDLFLIIFESTTIFTLSYMFAYSLATGSVDRTYTNEKIICSFILLTLVISGIGNFTIFNISIKNVISALLILYFSHSQGALLGGTMGILLGLTNHITQTEMPFILALYALGGLLGGVFRELGKIGSALGFIVGSCIVSFYINGYIISFISLGEFAVSLTLFGILYKKLDQQISDYVDKNLGKTKVINYSQRKENLIVDRLNEISILFKNLGDTFKSSTNMKLTIDPKEAYELVDKVANSVCSKCGMRRFCWEESFYTTYHSLYKLVSILEDKNTLTEELVPANIKDYCINKNDLVEEIKRNFSLFKINNMWKKKIFENRILVSDQLNEISNVINNLVNTICKEPIFREDVEEVIFSNLRNNRVDVEDVTVIDLGDKDFEIYVNIKKPYKESNQGENIRKLVSNSVNMPLKLCNNTSKGGNNIEKFKLIKQNRYSALTEVVSKANNNGISGDNYTFGEEENDYFIALSDGMGTGAKAHGESSIALDLLETFLEAKFDKTLALKTINSILMLKSNEELFTTLDISLLDLCTGKLQIIKSGAPATFIKRKDTVKIINPNSLPVGILKDVDFNVYEEYLEDGDVIIMMSDGIIEANEGIIDKERWMKKIIEDIDNLNPKTIADTIINKAKNEGKVNDDMTVLVTKVWRTV